MPIRTRSRVVSSGRAARRGWALPLARGEPLCPSSLMVLLFLKVTGIDSSTALTASGNCPASPRATGGFGTALGVIRTAWARGALDKVYASEARPWLQGARQVVALNHAPLPS